MRKIKRKSLIYIMAIIMIVSMFICIPSTYVRASEVVNVSYRTHVQTYGWQEWKYDGAIAGTSGQSKRLEGIEIVIEGNSNLGIQYTTHCQTYGWLPWSADGEMNGTEAESKRLEAIKIQLTGTDASKYDVYYRVHAQTYGWLSWAKNGQAAGTSGLAKRLEGIQVVVVPKGEIIPNEYKGITANNDKAYISKLGATDDNVSGADKTNVSYKTHIQTFGWQGWKHNGKISGTSGLSKRLEGINVSLTNQQYEGGIAYRTHVQSYGWQNWVVNGAMSGTSGESKRLEAIQILITGDMAKHYDLYYRVHAQTYGWLGWVKNGEPAGTAGYGKRLEAIQIVLVEKGKGNPGNVEGIVSASANGFEYASASQIPENPYTESSGGSQSGSEDSGNQGNTDVENNNGNITNEEIPEEWKVENYTYKITPLVPPFNEYYFVETDHPNPNAFRFVDSDCEYFAVEDAECWILHQTYVRYVDVEYTDYETGRIHNGYIFSKQYDGETDGGTLMVQQGVNNYGDHFYYIDSDVTAYCEPVKSKVDYLIENCTTEDMTFFEKLDAGQKEINKYSVYPQSVNDTSDVNENFPYPHFISGLHEDQYIMEQYDVMFGNGEEYIIDLLVQEAHPFSLDSLGVPTLMGKMARELEPDCSIKSTGSHYSYAITYNGETHYYGGSGSGSSDGIFTDVVEKLYYFDGSSKDFAANPSLANMSDKILEFGKESDEKLQGYKEMLTGETVRTAIFPGNWVKIREDYTGYEVYAYAGMFAVDTSYEFLSNTWVDGRYIDKYEIYEPGAKYEEHPTASIVIRNMTYKDVSGATITRDVKFTYYSSYDAWLAPYSYLRRNYYYSDTLDTLPDYMVLTREEVEAMDLDYNTNKLPENGISCDGTVIPGTPFSN